MWKALSISLSSHAHRFKLQLLYRISLVSFFNKVLAKLSSYQLPLLITWMEQQVAIAQPIISFHSPHLHSPITNQLLHTIQRCTNRLSILIQTALPCRQSNTDGMTLPKILEHVVRLSFQVMICNPRSKFEFLEGSITNCPTGTRSLFILLFGLFLFLIVEPFIVVDCLDYRGILLQCYLQ